MFGNIGATEIFLICGIITIFFGAKRIPEFARGLGKGISEFRREIKVIKNEIQQPIDTIKNQITQTIQGDQ